MNWMQMRPKFRHYGRTAMLTSAQI